MQDCYIIILDVVSLITENRREAGHVRRYNVVIARNNPITVESSLITTPLSQSLSLPCSLPVWTKLDGHARRR